MRGGYAALFAFFFPGELGVVVGSRYQLLQECIAMGVVRFDCIWHVGREPLLLQFGVCSKDHGLSGRYPVKENPAVFLLYICEPSEPVRIAIYYLCITAVVSSLQCLPAHGKTEAGTPS